MYQTSNLHITPETELSEIVLSNPNTIYFLEHFGIQVPLQTKTVSRICSELNIPTDLFIALANLYTGKDFIDISTFSYTDLPVIISFLNNTHRYYLDEIYPNIQQSIRLIQGLNDFEEIKMVDKFFQDYFDEVKEHLDYESSTVFPYISKLYECVHDKSEYPKHNSYSVGQYKDHHNDIEEKLNDLMNLLVKYLPHKNDQQARRKLLLNLMELDFDLKIHARIEDLILIPLVEKIEQQL